MVHAACYVHVTLYHILPFNNVSTLIKKDMFKQWIHTSNNKERDKKIKIWDNIYN